MYNFTCVELIISFIFDYISLSLRFARKRVLAIILDDHEIYCEEIRIWVKNCEVDETDKEFLFLI